MIKTTSLETSKLLKENGFRQDTSFDWVEGDMGGMSIARLGHESCWSKEHSHCSAPTTDELLEELPARLRLKEVDYWFSMSPLKENSAYDCRYKGYVGEGENQWQHTLKWFQKPLLCESLAKMWLYLKKEGLND